MNADLERLARAADPYWWDHLAGAHGKEMLAEQVHRILIELRDNVSIDMLSAVDDEASDKMVARGRAYSAFTAMIDSILSEEVKA